MDEWTVVAGVTGDIGQALAVRARQDGFLVVGVDIDGPPNGVDDWIECDLGHVDDLLVRDLREKLGRRHIRYVLTAVGGATAAELSVIDSTVLPMSAVREAIDLNLHSAFGVFLATLPSLRADTGDRSLTFVSSINAFGGYGAMAYSAAKAGLSGLIASSATDLAGDGIRVNGIALGTTRTKNLERLNRATGRQTDFSAMGRVLPRGSVLEPQEVGESAWAIASRCWGVTGQVVVCDGAQMLTRARFQPPTNLNTARS